MTCTTDGQVIFSFFFFLQVKDSIPNLTSTLNLICFLFCLSFGKLVQDGCATKST